MVEPAPDGLTAKVTWYWVFQFQVSPACDVGQEITYAWEWGQPGLFDTSPSAKEASSYTCLVPTDELEGELRFYHPAGGRQVRFQCEPQLRYKRAKQEIQLRARGIETLDYMLYRWRIGKTSPQDQAIAEWTNDNEVSFGEGREG